MGEENTDYFALGYSLGLLAEETNFYGPVQFCGQRPLSLTSLTRHIKASVSMQMVGWVLHGWVKWAEALRQCGVESVSEYKCEDRVSGQKPYSAPVWWKVPANERCYGVKRHAPLLCFTPELWSWKKLGCDQKAVNQKWNYCKTWGWRNRLQPAKGR